MATNIASIMLNVNGGSIISIDTETTPKLKGGRNNPHVGNIRKITTGAQVMVFTNKNGSAYEKSVRRRLEQEGKDPATFVLSPRTWGTRLEGTPFVRHVNKEGQVKHYLEVIFLRSGTTTYTYNGQPIDKQDVVGLDEKEEAEQGGLDNKVIIRTFDIASIKAIRGFGNTFNDLYFEME